MRKILLLTCLVVVLLLCLDQILMIYGRYAAKQELLHPKNGIIKPVKVFQIGFSKCGTVALANFFNENGVPAIHYDVNAHLPISIYENFQLGLPLLSDKYERYSVFTDMEILHHNPPISVGMQFFKELDRQYPGSKFILNTRNKQAWLRSRSRQLIAPSHQTLLKICAEQQGISEAAMVQRWSEEWDAHHQAVLEYFKDRPQDLVVFDIEKDNPKKLVEFFKDYFRLEAKYYTKQNQTDKSRIATWWRQMTTKKKIVRDFSWYNSQQSRAETKNDN